MIGIGAPQNVLVCDDERHIVRLLQVNLERQGHRVRVAFSGEEAMDQMRLERPDLLVLDADMPRMSGYDVIRAMRADPDLQSVQVILLDQPGADIPPDGPKPDRRLSKPFDPRQLLP